MCSVYNIIMDCVKLEFEKCGKVDVSWEEFVELKKLVYIMLMDS